MTTIDKVLFINNTGDAVPRKSSKKPQSNPVGNLISNRSKFKITKKLGLLLALSALLLTVTGVLGYSYLNDQPINIPLGGNGQGFGIWFGPHGEPHVELGWFGCCTPYCSEMYEIECSPEYGYSGTFHTEYCSQIPACNEGCCLPSCQEVPKVQCEGDYGFGDGGWLPSACTDVPECEIGCCSVDGVKRQEMKAPCEDIGGNWTRGECRLGYTVDATGTDTLSLGGIVSQTMNATIHMYTCSDTIDGLWNAVINAEADTSSSKGTKHSSTQGIPYNFEVENGKFGSQLDWGDVSGHFRGTIDESSFTYDYRFYLGTLGYHMTGEAPVKPGASECQESN